MKTTMGFIQATDWQTGMMRTHNGWVLSPAGQDRPKTLQAQVARRGNPSTLGMSARCEG